MEFFTWLLDLLLHIDKTMLQFIEAHGVWIYVLLVAIIFAETGLVFMPFLPGDSLLFTAGVLAGNANNNLNVFAIIILLIIAALLGDNTNYFIGRYLAKKGEGGKLFGIFTIKKEYLEKTESFYEKHGSKTIILARFVPIVRTFAPFVAGIGSMQYTRYISYCIMGAILWVGSITLAGYFLGSNEWIQHNFEKVVLGIVAASLLPVVFQFIKHKLAK